MGINTSLTVHLEVKRGFDQHTERVWKEKNKRNSLIWASKGRTYRTKVTGGNIHQKNPPPRRVWWRIRLRSSYQGFKSDREQPITNSNPAIGLLFLSISIYILQFTDISSEHSLRTCTQVWRKCTQVRRGVRKQKKKRDRSDCVWHLTSPSGACTSRGARRCSCQRNHLTSCRCFVNVRHFWG